MSAAVTITGISAVTWEGREHNSTTSFDTEHEQYEGEHTCHHSGISGILNLNTFYRDDVFLILSNLFQHR